MRRGPLSFLGFLLLGGCWGGGQCDAECIATLTSSFADGRVPGDVTLSSPGWSLVIPCGQLLDTAESSESYDGQWTFRCEPGSAYASTTDFVWPEPLTVTEGQDSWAVGPTWTHDGVCGSQCTQGSATLE